MQHGTIHEAGDEQVSDALSDDREATSQAAREILALLDRGGYEAPSGRWVAIEDAQAAAEAATRVYTPEELDELRSRAGARSDEAHVEVIAATTQSAAHDLAAEGIDVVLLNFASARNPGGGFLRGARAQEEELCRCSGVYRALLKAAPYYRSNRAERSLLYTDHAIYSPRVPFVRLSATSPWLEEPFVASVITAPAPNAGAIAQSQPERAAELELTFLRRWANVLAIAEHQRHRVVVLGAWGCGAFRNDPRLVAGAARTVLSSPRFAGAFDHVIFAIPDAGRSATNLRTFSEVLG